MTTTARYLIVMALRSESQGVFEDAGIDVLYCGVGKINAAMSLTRELCRLTHDHHPPQVVNFGTAGSRTHAAGSLVSCHEFVQRDMDASGLGFAPGVTPFEDAPARLRFDRCFANLPAAVCGTGDSFEMGAWRGDYDVVDMEAFALARVCLMFGSPFACAKYITDGADEAAALDWQGNQHRAAEEFLNLYRQMSGLS
jgi:adenosylhomocysteine nucleosidase